MRKNETAATEDARDEMEARRIIAAMKTAARARGWEIIGDIDIRNTRTGKIYAAAGKKE